MTTTTTELVRPGRLTVRAGDLFRVAGTSTEFKLRHVTLDENGDPKFVDAVAVNPRKGRAFRAFRPEVVKSKVTKSRTR